MVATLFFGGGDWQLQYAIGTGKQILGTYVQLLFS